VVYWFKNNLLARVFNVVFSYASFLEVEKLPKNNKNFIDQNTERTPELLTNNAKRKEKKRKE